MITFTHLRKIFLLCLACLATFTFSFAQASFSAALEQQPTGPNGVHRCSSVEVDAIRRMNNPNLPSIETFENWLAPKVADYKDKLADGSAEEKNLVLQIPVVVHVLHNGEPIGTAPNITDAQVLSQIQVLNEDFRRILGSRGYNENPVGADMEVEFVMALTAPDGSGTNGIVRRNINQDGVTVDDLESTIKPATIWEPTEYMNMWSVKFVAPDDNTLGYAQFPEGSGLAGLPASGEEALTDGVVMRYQSFGTSDLDDGTFILDAPYDLGRTATHEVGHWIGLRHIWGDGLGCNLGLPIPGCSCAEDDFCDDTPNSDNANYGCPDDKTSACDLPNPPTADMVENYMDYSDDSCMNVFTEDQKARAQTVMSFSPRRMELPNSPALLPPQAYVAFSTSNSSVVEGSSCDTRQVQIPLEISQVPSGTVTVTIGVDFATATADDFELLTSEINFTPSTSTSQSVLVSINEDTNIENLEYVTFSIIDVDGSGAAANYRQSHELTLADDDYAPGLAGWQTGVTIFQKSFGTGLGDWTISGVPGANVTWKTGSPANGMAASAYISRADLPGDLYLYDGLTEGIVELMSPIIDASLNSEMELSFDFVCFGEQDVTSGDLFDFGSVLYSCDGGTSWTVLGDPLVNEPMSTSVTLDLPPATNGCSNLRVAFRWQNDALVGFDPPLSVADVRIEGRSRAPVSVQTNLSNSSSYNFGPNATLYVYDEAEGKLLAKLENESNFDFGCTDVQIDRSRTSAGANAINFWNNNAGNALTAKTLRLIPTNIPSSEVNVRVTTYYGQAEMIAWEVATGNSRTELQMVTVEGEQIAAVNANNSADYSIQVLPAQVGTFNTSNITVEAVLNTVLDLGIAVGLPGNALPVELLNFNAKPAATAVDLYWETATEQNNSHFTIEHAGDDLQFREVAQKQGAGTTYEKQVYHYRHQNTKAGTNYYRLKQFDFSGDFSYSEIRKVEIEVPAASMKTYPNPVSSNLFLSMQSSETADFEISLTDLRGEVVRQLVLTSAYEQTLSIQGLQPGTYFLRWQSGSTTGVETIVVVPQ